MLRMVAPQTTAAAGDSMSQCNEEKQVTFLSALRGKATLHRLDYSDLEWAATWYNEDELHRLRKESQDDVDSWVLQVKEPVLVSRRKKLSKIAKAAPTRSCLVSSNTTKNTKSCQQSVSFNPNRTVRPCLHRNHCTEKEKKASWYSRNDLQRIKRENLQFLKLVASGVTDVIDYDGGTDDNGGIYCHRGLEGKTQKSVREKLELKRLAREAVFQEQKAQRESSSSSSSSKEKGCFSYDSEAIAIVYRKHSHYSQDVALTTAIADHISAYPPSSSTSSTTTTTTPSPRRLPSSYTMYSPTGRSSPSPLAMRGRCR